MTTVPNKAALIDGRCVAARGGVSGRVDQAGLRIQVDHYRGRDRPLDYCHLVAAAGQFRLDFLGNAAAKVQAAGRQECLERSGFGSKEFWWCSVLNRGATTACSGNMPNSTWSRSTFNVV